MSQNLARPAWHRMSEHVFVAIVLLIMSTCAPTFVASSWLVDKGVEGALYWLEPGNSSPDTAASSLVEKFATKAGQLTQAGVYTATRTTAEIFARVVVWALVLVGLIGWALIELRRALSVAFESLISLPALMFRSISRRK